MIETTERFIFEDADEFLKRFLIMSDYEIALVRTYFARTFFNDVFEIGAILRITSAKMRSGKSRVRRLTKLLCKNAFSVTAPTASSLWTIIDSQPYPPTIGINEADRMFGREGKELADIIATLALACVRMNLFLAKPVLPVAGEYSARTRVS
jgi:hypothetical protein